MQLKSTKTLREREREREREPFCERKLCKEWKKKWQIYNKREGIRRDKQRKMKGKMNNNIKVEGNEEMKR